MKDLRLTNVERRLAAVAVPPPPADLLERVLRDIPEADALARFAAPEQSDSTADDVERSWWIRLGGVAAALTVAIGAGMALASFLGETQRQPSVASGSPADGLHLPSIPEPEAPPAPRTSGALVVRVVDPGGHPVAGIRMRIRGLASDATRDAVTGGTGLARLDGLSPGQYEIDLRERDLVTTVSTRLVVRKGFTARAQVHLEPQRMAATMDVVGQTPIVETMSMSSTVSSMRAHLLRPLAADDDSERADGRFIDTAIRRASTFALDVDTASYTLAAGYLNRGEFPPPEVIRVEEFLNYFEYGDPAPLRDDFSIRSEVTRTAFASGALDDVIRINLRARTVDPRSRKPARLTFVVDVSGSMDGDDRLGLVRRSLALLAGALGPDDRVALVRFSNDAQVVVHPTGDRTAFLAGLDSLVIEGGTNAEAGLTLGYEVAARTYVEGGINRVVLCSDGVANVGETEGDPILDKIGAEARRGIELSAVGVGLGEYGDTLMERLAGRGNGRYVYLTSLNQARRFFVEGLTSSIQTVAEDARAQVEFDSTAVSSWRLLGYEDRALPDESFRDEAVDAGEIGAGHSVTVLYEVRLRPETRPGDRLATVDLRWRPADAGTMPREVRHEVVIGDRMTSWQAASAPLRLATVVAAFAERLRGPVPGKNGFADVLRHAKALADERPADADLAELVRLVASAQGMWQNLSDTDEGAAGEVPEGEETPVRVP